MKTTLKHITTKKSGIAASIFTSTLLASLATLALSLTGCAPSSDQLKKAIEKDPSIVFTAIEKDPEKFFEIVTMAQRKAQASQQEKQAKEEDAKRDEEFKNP